MSEFIVTNTQYGANFRQKPNTSGDFVNLPFGTRLRLVDDAGTKWKKVIFNNREGFVSDVNLTVVKSDAIARLISSCAHFWKLFDRGSGKEMDDPYRGYVEAMWKEIKTGPPLDKKGRMITNHKDWPWSAAAISSFVKRAKKYSGFRYGSRHSYFIHNSIRARDNSDTDAPFWGYQLNEKQAEVGDLVVQWRKKKQSYSTARSKNSFTSHTDVICEVRSRYVWAIGGNVGPHSVARKKYSLRSSGHLAGPAGKHKSDKTVFMVMKNVAK